MKIFNPLSTNPTKWSNTQPTNCLSVFDQLVGLVLKGSNISLQYLLISSNRSFKFKNDEKWYVLQALNHFSWCSHLLQCFPAFWKQLGRKKREVLDFAEILICYLENNFKNIKSLMKLCKSSLIWDNLFKNGPTEIYGSQSLKNLK